MESYWFPRSKCHDDMFDLPYVKDWYQYYTADAIAEPVIEVCSISISKNSFNCTEQEENPQIFKKIKIEENCQVYGAIWVEDQNGSRKCILYKRHAEDEDLDVISPFHCALTLTGPDRVSVISMKQPKLYLNIKEKATGASIVEGSCFLQNATADDFEKFETLEVVGQGGKARIDYIALRFGVAAVLKIVPQGYEEDGQDEEGGQVEDDGQDEDDSDSAEDIIDIYGSISVYYRHDYCKRVPVQSMKKTLRSKLFEKPASKSQAVRIDCPIDLSRWLVVVPAYSSLVIDLDLKDRATNEPLANGRIILETRSGCFTEIHFFEEGYRKFHMYVAARWKHTVTLDEASYDESLIPGWGYEELPNGIILNGFQLFDIFSVIIGRKNDEELRLYGTIKVYYAGLECDIFRATKEDPYTLVSGCKRLPLKCPSRAMSLQRCFSIVADLKDVNEQILIEGGMASSYGINFHQKSWFERRLCSVIKGAYENGFAAVNYMVMSCAIKAVVKVVFLSTPADLVLYGKMVAFYGNYEYTTENDIEDFRCVLFDRSEGDCFDPNGNTEVELSKSVVPVPVGSSLLVEVDLIFQSVGGNVNHVRGVATFDPGRLISYVDMRGDSLAIRVSIEWSQE